MEEYKIHCFKIAVSHRQWFKGEANKFLEPVVTGDETWVHHFTPRTKQTGMQWKNLTSLRAEEFSP
jgi:hypothetical protein